MFEGVRRSYVLLILYIMKIIERIGSDPAIELLLNAADKQGAIIAKELKKNIQKDLKPIEKGIEVYRQFMTDAGADATVYDRDKLSVTFLIKRCPFYEAFLDVGINCGIFLEGLCRDITLPTIQATLRHVEPKLKVEALLTRETLEEICLERVYLDSKYNNNSNC